MKFSFMRLDGRAGKSRDRELGFGHVEEPNRLASRSVEKRGE